MATPRTPYQDTSVPVERSKEQIRKALREAGAKGVQFDEVWGDDDSDPTVCVVRFIWPVDGGQATVRVQVKTLPPERGVRGTSWKISPERRDRQACPCLPQPR